MILAQMRLPDLILEPQCQMRVAFSETYAEELADYLDAGGALPPVVAFRDGPGPRAVLADGFHRRRAHEIARRKYIETDIRAGDLRAAIFYATSCNARSPLRPAPEDFKKAAWTLLADPEWGRWSDRKINELTGCRRDVIAQLRDLFAEQFSSGRKSQMKIGLDGVTVERGGSTYTMRFRDMTPDQQKKAVKDADAGHRAHWQHGLREALAEAERHAACLGEAYVLVRGHIGAAREELRRVEKAG